MESLICEPLKLAVRKLNFLSGGSSASLGEGVLLKSMRNRSFTLNSDLLLFNAVSAILSSSLLRFVLHYTVERNLGKLGGLRVQLAPDQRNLKDVDGSERLVLLDNLAVQLRDEEQGKEEGKTVAERCHR